MSSSVTNATDEAAADDDEGNDAAVASIEFHDVETVKAAANKAAMGLLVGTPCVDEDEGYTRDIMPLLPEVPTEPRGDDKYMFASAYKEVGNALFRDGQHAHALRTYLVGIQLLQRIGYDDPMDMMYDLEASAVCVACFSNAALCALKIERHDLCCRLCDGGLRFSPQGAELAKLLLRKAQATLDRPTHSDPHVAVELLQAAAAAANSHPVLELLQRAKKAAKEKSRAADRALFGNGMGFGRAPLATDATAKADARHECDELIRQGAAALLGMGAEREFVPPDLAEALGKAAPIKDAQAARTTFVAAEARAREAVVLEVAALAVRAKGIEPEDTWHPALPCHTMARGRQAECT